MLGGSVMQITCDAAPLLVLSLKQPASQLTCRSLSLTPFPSMDEQRNNQKKLRDDERDGPNNAPPVLFPCSGYPVFDNTARWQVFFGKPPSLELSPVEHVNTGSWRFQHHLCRRFAVQNLNRGIGGYFSGFRPTHNIATHGAR